jgi:hypothetical protein
MILGPNLSDNETFPSKINIETKTNFVSYHLPLSWWGQDRWSL